jgi:ubiquinone/menaquinone biosynthesis C-methylase UbiE
MEKKRRALGKDDHLSLSSPDVYYLKQIWGEDDYLSISHPEFDEVYYLKNNPDVEEHVAKIPGYTGWRQFVERGYLENRVGVSTSVYESVRRKKNRQIDEVIPPPYLRARVHGGIGIESFEEAGRILASNVFEYLAQDIRAGPEYRVLDFGVGCGRVLRRLDVLCREKSSPNQIRWYGCDIDNRAIEWCQRYLSAIGEFIVNDPHPPLPFPDQYFDFIYSISIFTHLPEDMQFAWLGELNRVLKLGGNAILSAHSFDDLPRNHKENGQIKDQINRGFHYNIGIDKTEGLPDFYQVSYHTREYIQREWSKYFAIEEFKERGIANHQNLILCRRLR